MGFFVVFCFGCAPPKGQNTKNEEKKRDNRNGSTRGPDIGVYRHRPEVDKTNMLKKLYDKINFSRGMKVIKVEPNENTRTENLRSEIKNSVD